VEHAKVTQHVSTANGVSTPPAAPARLFARRPRFARSDLIVLAVTGLALAIRLYLLSRLRYLTGITEYDDGVYLGGAVSLLSGALPYRDFAFVQPPGILLLMAPVALIAKAFAISSAMAVARLLTVGASTACVALTGALVRHRGPWVTLVACGVLAVYPDDIITAHTLLLEPWMNLLVLSGACLAFRGGRLAPPRALLCAGLLFGLAGAVKYWALIPALGLFAVCLAAGRNRRRAGWFACGAGIGFVVPTAPFAVGDPGLFLRSTVLDQAARSGSWVPESLRLAHLTGLDDLLNDAGRLAVSGNPQSLFARGDVTAAATWATDWLPVLLAAILAAALGLGYAAGRGRARNRAAAAAEARDTPGPGLDPLAWYALGTLGAVLVAVLGYSAFFYHYPDFAAPWLAITAGYAAGSPRLRPGRRGLTLAAGAIIVVASFQAWELSGLHASNVHADAALIPPGACVVTDEISLAIAANRFTAGAAGCPDVLDSLATTLVAGNGTSVQGGASTLPRVVAQWQAIFSRARYVWLSSSSGRRIPWTPGLHQWFARHFAPVHPPAGEFSEGQVYVRRGSK